MAERVRRAPLFPLWCGGGGPAGCTDQPHLRASATLHVASCALLSRWSAGSDTSSAARSETAMSVCSWTPCKREGRVRDSTAAAHSHTGSHTAALGPLKDWAGRVFLCAAHAGKSLRTQRVTVFQPRLEGSWRASVATPSSLIASLWVAWRSHGSRLASAETRASAGRVLLYRSVSVWLLSGRGWLSERNTHAHGRDRDATASASALQSRCAMSSNCVVSGPLVYNRWKTARTMSWTRLAWRAMRISVSLAVGAELLLGTAAPVAVEPVPVSSSMTSWSSDPPLEVV